MKVPISYKGNLSKGYVQDAGCDVILHKNVTFRPMCTQIFELDLQVDIPEGFMGMLIARTSAAIKGLNVAMCPIDPHYNGKINAIVHNISHDTITYRKGESFCQLVIVPMLILTESPIVIRKSGTRDDGKFGSTGR